MCGVKIEDRNVQYIPLYFTIDIAARLPVTEDEEAAAIAAVKEMLGPDQVSISLFLFFIFSLSSYLFLSIFT